MVTYPGLGTGGIERTKHIKVLHTPYRGSGYTPYADRAYGVQGTI